MRKVTDSSAVIIICSRLASTRFPSKALLKIEGQTILDHIITRVQPAGIPIVLAVPNNEVEPAYMDFLTRYPETVRVFGGDPDSPLHRMVEAVNAIGDKPTYIIRITHDDPLIDCDTMTELLEKCQREQAGYGISPEICEGAGVEVIHIQNLFHAGHRRQEPTEYVSYFVKSPDVPIPSQVTVVPRKSIKRPYRLTVDYPEDALTLKMVLREAGGAATLDEVCRYIDSHPYVMNINRLPEISFYTCVKDMEQWIGDTILSVLEAGIQNMEYVIVDDGSRDHTLAEIAKFSGDRRLTLVVNDWNMGLASSSNVAAKEARGKYVMRVDADDMLIAGAFREAWPKIKAMIDEGTDIVYPAYRTVNVFGGVEKDHVDPRTNHHAGCAIMRRSFLNELRFRDGLKHWDGLELYRRTSQCAKIQYFDEPIWQYRIHEDSLSNSKPEERRQALMQLDKEFQA